MMQLKNPIAEEYAQNIQAIVNQLKKTSKKGIAENAAYLVDADTARVKYNGRIGETFYLFPNKAPSQEVIDAFNECKPHYIDSTFERYLSNRGMTILFFGSDLVIRKDRTIFIERLSENNLHRIIELAKERTVIDWDNAKFYIYPYKSFHFFISDSFEKEILRQDTADENYWFSIPFTEDFDYTEIRQMCKDFAKEHPLVEETPLEITISLDDVLKDLQTNLNTKSESEPESTLNPEPTPAIKQNNSGCMVLFGLLIPSLLFCLL